MSAHSLRTMEPHPRQPDSLQTNLLRTGTCSGSSKPLCGPIARLLGFGEEAEFVSLMAGPSPILVRARATGNLVRVSPHMLHL